MPPVRTRIYKYRGRFYFQPGSAVRVPALQVYIHNWRKVNKISLSQYQDKFISLPCIAN